MVQLEVVKRDDLADLADLAEDFLANLEGEPGGVGVTEEVTLRRGGAVVSGEQEEREKT